MTDKTRKSGGQGDGGPEQVEAFDPLPGDLLREARNRRGWTPARVAEDMNLEVRFVEAMEENRFEDLGAPVFARGHLRKYARLLEVDSERLMDAYAVIERERIPPPEASAEGLRMTGAEPPRRGGLRAFAVVVVLGALAVLAWRLLLTDPETASTAEQAADAVRPAAESPVEVDPDPLDAPVAVPLPTNLGSDEPPVAASAQDTAPEPAVEEPAPAPAAAEPVVEPAPAAPSAPGARLVLRFDADSWVEVRDAGGNRLVYQLGRAGRQRSVTGTPPFDIFLGFADGVSIELNGESVPIPSGSRLGRTARFRLPADTTAAIRP